MDGSYWCLFLKSSLVTRKAHSNGLSKKDCHFFSTFNNLKFSFPPQISSLESFNVCKGRTKDFQYCEALDMRC